MKQCQLSNCPSRIDSSCTGIDQSDFVFYCSYYIMLYTIVYYHFYAIYHILHSKFSIVKWKVLVFEVYSIVYIIVYSIVYIVVYSIYSSIYSIYSSICSIYSSVYSIYSSI